jgi:hypothetical protein
VSDIIPITFTALLKNGVLNRKYQEKYMLTQIQKKKRRMNSKKDTEQILVGIQDKEKEFTVVVSTDESFSSFTIILLKGYG